eukprot:CAMPEP_0179105324 /NCGR_PEP_ID=MMETSP0796-20121207/48911_1 /TAXON_ID=73915 /ORGANISM="Pyrodinium bahamense, Strain pbaha01" /LENGTH=114 /DNA_ID=CAMNT_0020803311 /DNA_START=287 /DNA_END=633 /DNA_ORIENTATION=+
MILHEGGSSAQRSASGWKPVRPYSTTCLKEKRPPPVQGMRPWNTYSGVATTPLMEDAVCAGKGNVSTQTLPDAFDPGLDALDMLVLKGNLCGTWQVALAPVLEEPPEETHCTEI